MIEVERIKDSAIIAPYYPHDEKCGYCRGDYPVDHVMFEVLLKNGQKIKKVCSVCLYENVLEHPEEIDLIKNIGEWS